MSKSYTVGYMPKPSYSGTKYEELKDVLKESGIISEHTPDNAIQTVVEESLVDLKPENIKAGVTIGTIEGTIITDVSQITIDNVYPNKVSDSKFNVSKIHSKYLHSNGVDLYLSASNSGQGGLVHVNTKTGKVTTITETSYIYDYFFETSDGYLIARPNSTSYGDPIILKGENIIYNLSEIIQNQSSTTGVFSLTSGSIIEYNNCVYIPDYTRGYLVFNGTNIEYYNNLTWTSVHTINGKYYMYHSSSYDEIRNGLFTITDNGPIKLYDKGTSWSKYITQNDNIYVYNESPYQNVLHIKNNIVTELVGTKSIHHLTITNTGQLYSSYTNGAVYYIVEDTVQVVYTLPEIYQNSNVYLYIHTYEDTQTYMYLYSTLTNIVNGSVAPVLLYNISTKLFEPIEFNYNANFSQRQNSLNFIDTGKNSCIVHGTYYTDYPNTTDTRSYNALLYKNTLHMINTATTSYQYYVTSYYIDEFGGIYTYVENSTYTTGTKSYVSSKGTTFNLSGDKKYKYTFYKYNEYTVEESQVGRSLHFYDPETDTMKSVSIGSGAVYVPLMVQENHIVSITGSTLTLQNLDSIGTYYVSMQLPCTPTSVTKINDTLYLLKGSSLSSIGLLIMDFEKQHYISLSVK